MSSELFHIIVEDAEGFAEDAWIEGRERADEMLSVLRAKYIVGCISLFQDGVWLGSSSHNMPTPASVDEIPF